MPVSVTVSLPALPELVSVSLYAWVPVVVMVCVPAMLLLAVLTRRGPIRGAKSSCRNPPNPRKTAPRVTRLRTSRVNELSTLEKHPAGFPSGLTFRFGQPTCLHDVLDRTWAIVAQTNLI